jgi:hypothetical protein
MSDYTPDGRILKSIQPFVFSNVAETNTQQRIDNEMMRREEEYRREKEEKEKRDVVKEPATKKKDDQKKISAEQEEKKKIENNNVVTFILHVCIHICRYFMYIFMPSRFFVFLLFYV